MDRIKFEEIPVKKNEEYTVEIVDQGYEGEGIAKVNNFTIFIPNAIKGEKVKILIVKVLANMAYGKILEIIEASKYRVSDESCKSYKRCGGCDLRHMDYEYTLEIKQQKVQNLINKTFGQNNKIKVGKTIGMGVPYYYRNKAQYPFGQDNVGETTWGVYAKRTHEIIPIRDCQIQSPVSEKIAFAIYKFMKENSIPAYNEKTLQGIIRHVIVKVGIRSHEIMCIIVVNTEQLPKEKQLIQMLKETFPEIKTIIKNVNTKKTNVILGDKNINLYGDGYILDTLGEYIFKISAMSFYQVNPTQAELLYNIGIEKANLTKEDILFDLYCGIGTIGIFASKYVKKVYGIEKVSQAIEDAKENAKMNEITNIEFLTGDVEKVLDDLLQKRHIYPDAVIIDPPRKGLENNTIENLLAVEPKKIIYISCNPATMVRDVKLLNEKYEIGEIQPVDMFPFTSHVECVAVLQLR